MNKLEQLIQELCPHGVEYKKLGEVGINFYRGSGITKDDLSSSGTPCVRYGELYTSYGIWFDKCVCFVDENKVKSKKFFEKNDILFAITGEKVEDIAKSSAYIGEEQCLAGGDIVVMKHNQNAKYLSYALSTSSACQQKSFGKVKSKVVHSSIPAIKEIVIPVPPLEIQKEIVRILDTFTELEKELEKELEARKKQYEFYREQLLSFDESIPVITLKDVCMNISSGGTPLKSKKEFYNGDIPWLRTQEVKFNEIYKTENFITELAIKNSSAKWIPANCVIIAISGATAGRSAINKIPLTTNQHCCNLEINSDLALYKFVYYWVAYNYENIKNLGRGAREDLNVGIISKFKIPLPPLEEQERIVNILDRFDALCNDLTCGLPAEIEARRKQYAYYRDKLLTFKNISDKNIA